MNVDSNQIQEYVFKPANSVRFAFFVALLFSCAMCGQNLLPTQSGYPAVPRFLPGEPDTGALSADVYSLIPHAMRFSSAGIPQSITSDGKTLIGKLEVEISKMGSSEVYSSLAQTGKTSLFRTSLFFRGGGRSDIGKTGDTLGTLESYIEAVEKSPRLTQYHRFLFSQDGYFRFKFKFSIPHAYDQIVLRNLKGMAEFSVDKLPKNPSTIREFHNMSFISRKEGNGFAVAYFPLITETRRWYQDDYQVTQAPGSQFKLTSEQDDILMEVWSDSVKGVKGETFDQYFTIISLLQGDLDANNYYSPIVETSNSRYFPVEGFTFKGPTQAQGFKTIHEEGFSWGFPTSNFSYGKNLRKIGIDTIHGICRDDLIRHFFYFYKHTTKYGLLPFTILPSYMVEETKEKEKISSDFMFGQAGAEDVDFASKIIPTLTGREKAMLYDRISRLRVLFDPAEKLSWTIQLPTGEYWFEYSNLWKSEGDTNYIVNTHVTALRIAIHMRDLSHKMGVEKDESYWAQLVEKGTDGLLWFIKNPKNWGITAAGHRELGYKIGIRPLHNYHNFLVDDLMYLLDTNLMTYRADEVRAALTGKE
jgi:hypothetical protein